MDDRTDAKRRADEPARYDRDLYGWAVQQAALLRAGRITEADILNIAEEIDDVGNEQYDKLESAIRVILLHLLKWDHQSAKRSRSWHLSVAVQRRQPRGSCARIRASNLVSRKPSLMRMRPQGSKPQGRPTSTRKYFPPIVPIHSMKSWSGISPGRRRIERFAARFLSL